MCHIRRIGIHLTFVILSFSLLRLKVKVALYFYLQGVSKHTRGSGFSSQMNTGYGVRGKSVPTWVKELNPRRKVYVEIPKPSRVEPKCS
jgi:hypothetical protein